MMNNLPSDPAILLSYVNTKLRDVYPSLTELCLSEGVDPEELSRRLEAMGVQYIPELNQFR